MNDVLNKKAWEIVEQLAELGFATEEMGNECFLCSYQPAHGRRQKAPGYRPPYAPPPKREPIKDETYPHENFEDCLIFEAMGLIKDRDNEI